MLFSVGFTGVERNVDKQNKRLWVKRVLLQEIYIGRLDKYLLINTPLEEKTPLSKKNTHFHPNYYVKRFRIEVKSLIPPSKRIVLESRKRCLDLIQMMSKWLFRWFEKYDSLLGPRSKRANV